MNKPNIEKINSSPLESTQVDALKSLLSNLKTDQLQWINGYISSLLSQINSEQVATPELTVLYGTESGNSETLADLTVKATKAAGFKAKAINMADQAISKLKDIKNLLVIVSTWGEGDPPETACDFYQAFMGNRAPKMTGTRYAVLGLGDTSYDEFCKIGKDFDARLESLGARRIYDRVDCDVDFDDDFESWKKGVLAVLEPDAKTAKISSSVVVTPANTTPIKYNRKNPYPAELLERIVLNGEGSAKETIHLEFKLEDTALVYEPGDALAVIPQNSEDLVNDIIGETLLDPETQVHIKDEIFSLNDALTSQLDITSLSLPVIKRYNEVAQNARLKSLLSPDNKAQLQQFMNGREIIDLLNEYPINEISADALVGIMRKLPPRLYSIASSPKEHPNEVHLTVGVVRYDTHGRQRKGVCSTYLAERIATGKKVKVFVTQNKNFKLPSDSEVPVIMVGPGTGIAPFRAFMEERKAIAAKGKNWLFFGEQHYLTDFLYQSEWQEYLADGLLTKLNVAFSRDQKKKIYVQDRMYENSKEIYSWLEEGASFYVCGDASRMANDVDLALHDIIKQESNLSYDAAQAYVKKLKEEKRYLRDVY